MITQLDLAKRYSNPELIDDVMFEAWKRVNYKTIRAGEYQKANLAFLRFVELQTEEDAEGIAQYIADKQAIQTLYPEPSQADIDLIATLTKKITQIVYKVNGVVVQ